MLTNAIVVLAVLVDLGMSMWDLGIIGQMGCDAKNDGFLDISPTLFLILMLNEIKALIF